MMKLLRYGLLSLTVLAVGLSFNDPAWAQAKVLVTPDALTVTGTRGEAIQETRTLTVRSTAPVTNLRIYVFDLYNRDRDRIFPKRLITVPATIAQVNADTLESFPVEFNLQEAFSGEFLGDILISYEGNERTVPVIVRVKDPWYIPFALLVFGVVLGTTVSSYSRWGKNTDEISVSLNNLRTEVETDQELPPSFKSQIATHLADAKLQRDAKQLESARESITGARTLWSKWFRQREEWIEVMKVGKTLQEELAKPCIPDLQTLYIQTIQRNLKETLTAVVNFTSPNEFAQRINCLSQQQTFYRRVYRHFDDLQQALDNFKPSNLEQSDRQELQTLKDKATDLKQQLLTLLPSNQPEEPALKAIENGIIEAAQKLKDLQESVEDFLPIDDLEEFKRGAGKSLEGETPANEPVPEAPIFATAETPSIPADENPILQGITRLIPNPNRRLQLFSFAGYLTTIAFLAGTGFNQLYLEQPTFGANGLRDYFALLAWGFGAEATRSTVTNALRRTDQSNP